MVKKQTHTTKGIKPPSKHSNKAHAKVYWPYLPLVLILFGSAFLNIWQPLQVNKTATLAYATQMSRSGLLVSTNEQRNANGQSSLKITEKLNSSAQAKANDMVARDYWAHNTPDGKEPWVFIDAEGYLYTKAGENLAYGFSDPNTTVIGWMNSPSHRANMLDTAFSEVGFGFANSVDFVGTGNETIIVAHYGAPTVASAVTPATPAVQQQSKTVPTKKIEVTVAPEQIADVPVPTLPVPEPVLPENQNNQPTNTDTVVSSTEEPKRITVLQQLTGGKAPWSAAAISILAFSLSILWIAKHYVKVRRYIIGGEQFIAHHPILDLTVVSIVAFAIYLSQSTGVIL